MKPPERKPKLKSLADYLVRYDLAATLEEAQLEYSQSASGGPRLLEQKEIAARFRKARPAKPAANE
jgi:hypothetical protein